MTVKLKKDSTDREYWEKRMYKRTSEWWRKEENVEKRLIKEFNKAQVDIEGEISKLYGRYAGKTGMTYEKASRYLNSTEVEALHDKIGRLKDEWLATGDPEAYNKYKAIATRKRIQRLEGTMADIDLRLSQLGATQSEIMTTELTGIYSGNYYGTIYDIHNGTGYITTFSKVDVKHIKELIKLPMPTTGKDLSSSIWGNINNLSRTIKETMVKGSMLGKSLDSMAKDIAVKTGTAKKNAMRLMRTETAYMLGQSSLDSYEQTGVDKYQYIATLDSRTAEGDAALDGQVFPLKEAMPGFNYYPMHPNCRCDSIPYIAGAIEKRIAKDLKTGKVIELDRFISYNEWSKIVEVKVA